MICLLRYFIFKYFINLQLIFEFQVAVTRVQQLGYRPVSETSQTGP